ncbi:hypothetical protein WL29_22580 [Burkholderia ubonensis]|uniref:Uncharacterized protein n=1 Tax=Burkholderia ubonensis TaxID=101571 RepID=A0A119HFM1_9BURK|nr:hypothetical protein [Burkholderia ubonensis]KWA84152.1 hypothetical protein WL29_22580 [Burkholderia ubonensis]
MPRLSDDTLFKRALPLAIEDRIALSQCYPRGTEHSNAALAEAEAMKALKGKKLAQLTPDEDQVAFSVFVCAEQWEAALADSNATGDRKVATESARNARLFKEARLERWGRTQLEVAIANSISVPVKDIFASPPKK